MKTISKLHKSKKFIWVTLSSSGQTKKIKKLVLSRSYQKASSSFR